MTSKELQERAEQRAATDVAAGDADSASRPKYRYLTLTPERLAELTRNATWHFEQAFIMKDGEMRRAADKYQEAMNVAGGGGTQDLEDATRLLKDILEELPEFGEGHFQLARIYLRLDDKELALKLARNAVAMHSENFAYQALMAVALQVNGCEQELETLAAYLKEHMFGQHDRPFAGGASAEHVVSIAVSLVLPGFVVEDRQLLLADVACGRRLAALDTTDSETFERALGELERFVAEHPKFAEAHFWLAECHRRQENLEKSLEICEDARARRIGDWPILIECGVLYWLEGRASHALECFEEAALINPSLPIFAPHYLTEKSAAELADWYLTLLDRLPLKVGVYSGVWTFSDPPSLNQHMPQQQRPDAVLRREAFGDIMAGVRRARAWWFLARNDIASRYRRTTLGPWWVVLGTAIALVGMASVWTLIFGLEMQDFFPYLSSGYATWLLLSALVVEGCATFSDGQAAAIQKSMDVPRFFHVFRVVTRNFLIFFHTLGIFVVAAMVYQVGVTQNTFLVPLGLVLLYLNGLWVAALFGMVGARYRDFGPAVGAIMTVVFFVTPVLWKTEMLGERASLAQINPFTHLIAVVREPLLGIAPSALSWTVVVGLCIGGWLITFLAYARVRQRIIFWV